MINHICFFDTETNGKPRNWKAHMRDVDNWPRVVQLAWRVVALDSSLIQQGKFMIRPDGWEIPREDFFIRNNLTTERCIAEGDDIHDVLKRFVRDLQDCEWLVAHNISFDYNVLGAELIRADVRSDRRPQRICTMESTVHVCKIPFPGRSQWGAKRDGNYKWPKLEELYKVLFNADMENAHDAMGDVYALERCFFELVKRGVISLAMTSRLE